MFTTCAGGSEFVSHPKWQGSLFGFFFFPLESSSNKFLWSLGSGIERPYALSRTLKIRTRKSQKKKKVDQTGKLQGKIITEIGAGAWECQCWRRHLLGGFRTGSGAGRGMSWHRPCLLFLLCRCSNSSVQIYAVLDVCAGSLQCALLVFLLVSYRIQVFSKLAPGFGGIFFSVLFLRYSRRTVILCIFFFLSFCCRFHAW